MSPRNLWMRSREIRNIGSRFVQPPSAAGQPRRRSGRARFATHRPPSPTNRATASDLTAKRNFTFLRIMFWAFTPANLQPLPGKRASCGPCGLHPHRPPYLPIAQPAPTSDVNAISLLCANLLTPKPVRTILIILGVVSSRVAVW